MSFSIITLGSATHPPLGYLIALKRRPLDANSQDLLRRERELMRGRKQVAKGYQRKNGFVGMDPTDNCSQWSEEYLADSEFIYRELERLEAAGKGTGLRVVKGEKWEGERDIALDEKDIRAKCLIRKPIIKIGLMDSCDIRLKIPGVSRLHVTLDCSTVRTKLTSHSANPPFLSPHIKIERNEAVEIENGTIINIYNRRFVFVAFASPPPPGVFADPLPDSPKASTDKTIPIIPPTPLHRKISSPSKGEKYAASMKNQSVVEEEADEDVSVTSTIDEGSPEDDLVCLDEVSSSEPRIQVPSTPTLEQRPRSIYPPLTVSRPLNPCHPASKVNISQFEKEQDMLRARREKRRASVGDSALKRTLTFVDSKSKEEWLEGMKKSQDNMETKLSRSFSIEDFQGVEGVKIAHEGSRNSRRISDILTGHVSGEDADESSSSDGGDSSIEREFIPGTFQSIEEPFDEHHEDIEVPLNDAEENEEPPRSSTPPGIPNDIVACTTPLAGAEVIPNHKSPPCDSATPRAPTTPVITSLASLPRSQSFSRRLSLREKVLIRNGISATLERERGTTSNLTNEPVETVEPEIVDVEMGDAENRSSTDPTDTGDIANTTSVRQKGRSSAHRKTTRRSDSFEDLRTKKDKEEKEEEEVEEEVEREFTSPTQQRRIRSSLSRSTSHPLHTRPSSPISRHSSPRQFGSPRVYPDDHASTNPSQIVPDEEGKVVANTSEADPNEPMLISVNIKSKFQQSRETVIASRRSSQGVESSAVLSNVPPGFSPTNQTGSVALDTKANSSTSVSRPQKIQTELRSLPPRRSTRRQVKESLNNEETQKNPDPPRIRQSNQVSARPNITSLLPSSDATQNGSVQHHEASVPKLTRRSSMRSRKTVNQTSTVEPAEEALEVKPTKTTRVSRREAEEISNSLPSFATHRRSKSVPKENTLAAGRKVDDKENTALASTSKIQESSAPISKKERAKRVIEPKPSVTRMTLRSRG